MKSSARFFSAFSSAALPWALAQVPAPTSNTAPSSAATPNSFLMRVLLVMGRCDWLRGRPYTQDVHRAVAVGCDQVAPVRGERQRPDAAGEPTQVDGAC